MIPVIQIHVDPLRFSDLNFVWSDCAWLECVLVHIYKNKAEDEVRGVQVLWSFFPLFKIRYVDKSLCASSIGIEQLGFKVSGE